LDTIVDEVNDKHLASWANACSAANIQNTPLDPTMTIEHLLNKCVNLDGSKLEKLGFKFDCETITEDGFKEVSSNGLYEMISV
jgi:hypothetical protein